MFVFLAIGLVMNVRLRRIRQLNKSQSRAHNLISGRLRRMGGPVEAGCASRKDF